MFVFRRCIAVLIDTIVVLFFAKAADYFSYAVLGGEFQSFSLVVEQLIFIAYFSILMVFYRKTLGMLLVGLRLNKSDGSDLNFRSAILWVMPLSFFSFLGFISLVLSCDSALVVCESYAVFVAWLALVVLYGLASFYSILLSGGSQTIDDRFAGVFVSAV